MFGMLKKAMGMGIGGGKSGMTKPAGGGVMGRAREIAGRAPAKPTAKRGLVSRAMTRGRR